MSRHKTGYVISYHPPGRSASGIDSTSKNYLKWRAIQLVIHSIVGA